MAWIRACGGGAPAIPDGKTVTPINDVTIWQQCAGIANPTYTTLGEVLADTGILQTLMASDNAVDYLVRSKTFIGSESMVPVMTSDTTPSGEASASSVTSYYPDSKAYKAFDANNSTEWWSDTASNEWVQYQFTSAKVINKVTVLPKEDAGGPRVKNFKVQASNDGVTFTDLYTGICANTLTAQTFTFTNNTAYTYYRFFVVDSYGVNNIAIYTLTFALDGICQSSTAMTDIGANNYCANTLLADSDWREAICNSSHFESVLNVKTPVMTSNTTPSGVVSAKNYYGGGSEAFKAFDGNTSTNWAGSAEGTSTSNNYLQYAFDTKKKIYKADVNFSVFCTAVSFRMQGINSGVITDLTDTLNVRNGSLVFSKNINEYDAYRFQIDTYTQNASYACPRMDEAQLYGREDV